MSCGRRSVRMSTASDFSRPPSRFHLHLLAPTPQLSSTTFTNFAGILVGTPGADWTSVSAKILSLSHFAAFGPPLGDSKMFRFPSLARGNTGARTDENG
jgi:hypothetical protein